MARPNSEEIVPFNDMASHLRDTTCAILSNAGLDSADADWLRQRDYARRAVRLLKDERRHSMEKEQRVERESEYEQLFTTSVQCIVQFDKPEEESNTGIKCPSCQHVHTMTKDEIWKQEILPHREAFERALEEAGGRTLPESEYHRLRAEGYRSKTCERCGREFRYHWIDASFCKSE